MTCCNRLQSAKLLQATNARARVLPISQYVCVNTLMRYSGERLSAGGWTRILSQRSNHRMW